MPPPNVNKPHDFKEFLSRQRPPILIVGSGLSFGLVPEMDEIVAEKKDQVATELEIDQQPTEEGSYRWARYVIDALIEKGTPRPRLRLAEALGFLNEPMWTASCGLPLSRTEPRHRVIARFAREQLWKTICSLNWDTHIENALLRIGFQQGQVRYPKPWISEFRSIVTKEDFPTFGAANCFCILKPHGCVRALRQAKEAENTGSYQDANEMSDRLKITDKDLKAKRDDPVDKWFLTQIQGQLGQRPLMVAGWSISEPYLQGVINASLHGLIQAETPGELTIVDIDFNVDGHQKAAEVYGLQKDNVYAQLETSRNGFDANSFFLWLQVRYALDQLNEHCQHELEGYLLDTRQSLEDPICDHPLLSWVDTFLPAWVRLCWRSGFVQHRTFEPHMIPTDLEDSYVPLYPEGIDRPDLKLASNILFLISHLKLLWNFERFPGAIFSEESGCLVIPLPWDQPTQDLGALSSLMDVIEREIGYVSTVSILPIPSDLTSLPEIALVNDLRIKLAAQMRVMRFAKVENIDVIEVPLNLF